MKKCKCGQESSEWFNQLDCTFVISEFGWITTINTRSRAGCIDVTTKSTSAVVRCAIDIWNAILQSLIIASLKGIVLALIGELPSSICLWLCVLCSHSKTLCWVGQINNWTAAVLSLASRFWSAVLSCCTVRTWSASVWESDSWRCCHFSYLNL